MQTMADPGASTSRGLMLKEQMVAASMLFDGLQNALDPALTTLPRCL